MNFAANGECAALTGDALNFGAVSGNVTQVNQETLRGWGVRQSDWQWGITLQQEVIPRVSAEVAYNRRWFHGRQGDRQHASRPRGLRAVYDRGPAGSAAARRRRLPDHGSHGDGRGRRSRRAELRHVRNGLRPGAHLVLARRRFHAERAPPPGTDAAVRDADRPVESRTPARPHA